MFLWRLPGFLRNPVVPNEARTILRRRLQSREAELLAFTARAIYSNPSSPCAQLLKLAGCEQEDLARLVRVEGVEGALGELFRRGVYLSVDEFKGRRPVVRGSATLSATPCKLRNAGAAAHVLSVSSGSRGASTQVPSDLAFIRDRAVNLSLSFGARGGEDWVYGLWGVPGGAYIVRALEYSGFGARPVRWFSQVDPAAAGLHPRYRWSGRVLRYGSLLAGMPLPEPEYAPLDDPNPVLEWAAQVLRGGRTPHLHTFSSAAVRLCQAALERGTALNGARLTITGEPVTAARLAVIDRAGARAEPRYGAAECTPIAYGCMAPDAPDDVHLFHDLYAVIQAGSDGESRGFPSQALLISPLLSTSPLALLNLSLGDQGELVERSCGCPMERLGWKTHLRSIRSYEKLTVGGMTFLDTDVVGVLDEVLPARFGGGPTDYQVLEEREGSEPRLTLLVHPRLGQLDPEAIADVFLAALGGGSGAERVMELQWRGSRLLKIERRAALPEASGKILHLHQERSSRGSEGGEEGAE